MQTLLSLQRMRGFAALAVFFYHAHTLASVYGDTQVIPDIAQMGRVGVDLFFTLSGFVMAWTCGKYFTDGSAKDFMIARIGRIYPAYWLFSLPVALAWALGMEINSGRGGEIDILPALFLLPSHNQAFVPVAWTLVFELYFYLFFALLIRFSSFTHLPRNLWVWGSLCVVIHPLALDHQEWWGAWVWVVFNPFVIEFCMGAFVGLYYLGNKPKYTFTAMCLSCVLFVVISYYKLFQFPAIDKDALSRVAVYATPCALLVFALVGNELKSCVKKTGVLQFYGDISYSFYLCHVLVLHAFGKFFGTFAGYTNIVYVVFSLIVSTLVAYVSYHRVERPALRLVRSLCK